jgi:RNA polymerase sigma-70 factor (ECF subfamily)
MDLYKDYGPALHRYLTRRLADAQRAQDLAQEVYLRLYQIEDQELIRAPQAYLFRIASNLVYDFHRREKHSPVIFDSGLADDCEHASEPSMADAGELIDMQQQLSLAMEKLPPTYAAVLLLKKRDGYSLEEIARELNLSTHTVKKYLFLAVARCREALVNGGPVLAILLAICGCGSRQQAPQKLRCEVDQPHLQIDGKAFCRHRDVDVP